MIEEKLESLRRAVRRVSEKRPADVQTLENDFDLQDILTLNLSRAIQLCVDIGMHLISDLELPPPDTMGQTFDVLRKGGVIGDELAKRLKAAVGFRNVAVHNYELINWSIVHSIATNHLGDFADFAKAISSRL
jgi:uncharacterized protein YutE (UPF0331/DUF86 family)